MTNTLKPINDLIARGEYPNRSHVDVMSFKTVCFNCLPTSVKRYIVETQNCMGIELKTSPMM